MTVANLLMPVAGLIKVTPILKSYIFISIWIVGF